MICQIVVQSINAWLLFQLASYVHLVLVNIPWVKINAAPLLMIVPHIQANAYVPDVETSFYKIKIKWSAAIHPPTCLLVIIKHAAKLELNFVKLLPQSAQNVHPALILILCKEQHVVE